MKNNSPAVKDHVFIICLVIRVCYVLDYTGMETRQLSVFCVWDIKDFLKSRYPILIGKADSAQYASPMPVGPHARFT